MRAYNAKGPMVMVSFRLPRYHYGRLCKATRVVREPISEFVRNCVKRRVSRVLAK